MIRRLCCRKKDSTPSVTHACPSGSESDVFNDDVCDSDLNHDSLRQEGPLEGRTLTTTATTTSSATTENLTKRMEALEIANTATFEELDEGYNFTHKWGKTEWVDMSKPRPCSYMKDDRATPCSYTKWNDVSNKYEIVTVVRDSRLRRLLNFTIRSRSHDDTPGVELRGITLRQLRAIMANIIRRCKVEKWVDFKGVKLDPEDVKLYDADKYIIRPYTVKGRKSLVAQLPSTAGPQPPRFFVSHWWGESVQNFISCIEQFVRDFGRNKNDNDDRRGGGMTADTPIWVCAYGNNQWDLSDITVDPRESGFTKAMKIAKGRTITILDNEGTVFTRVWCIFELYLTLIASHMGEEEKEDSEKGLWCVYTAKKHIYVGPGDKKEERESVGIISGGSPSDQNFAPNTTAREKSFPYEVISKALTIEVENADASVDDDKVHILNSIIGRSRADINERPPKEHATYIALNDALKSIFAASPASIQGAMKEGDKEWTKMLVALSKGTKNDDMRFDFGSKGEFSGLNATRAAQLVSHLPLSIKRLTIVDAEFDAEFVDALIERVKQFKSLEDLMTYDTSVGGEKEGQEVGARLAKVLAVNTTIKQLVLDSRYLFGSDNVVQWGDALMENKTLTDLSLWGVNAEIYEELRTKTKDRTPELVIYRPN